MLPSTIAVSLFLAHGTDWLPTAFGPVSATRVRPTMALRTAWAGVLGLMAVYPVWSGYRAPAGQRPGAQLEMTLPRGAVVVVPRLLDFTPILHYQRRPDIEYVFPMDREAFQDPRVSGAALYMYNLLRVVERRGYLAAVRADTSNPLCTYSGLFVALPDKIGWLAVRIAADSSLTTDRVDGSGMTPASAVAVIIHSRDPSIHHACVQGVGRAG